MSNFSSITWPEQVNLWRDDDDAFFVLEQHVELYYIEYYHLC
jgi:hypothetical protein